MSDEHVFDDLVTVARFNFAYQAHLLAGKLETEGIMAFVHDENNISIAPFISQIHGGIRVEVKESQREQAEEVMKMLDDAVTPATTLHPVIDINGKTFDLVKGTCPECSVAAVYLGRPGILPNTVSIAATLLLSLPLKLDHKYFCFNCHHEWEG